MRILRASLLPVLGFVVAALWPDSALAQVDLSAKNKALYDQIKASAPTGVIAKTKSLVLKRDRVTMTFSGTFYFMGAVDGRVTAAVFLGKGNFHADPPPSHFERDNLKRLLSANVVESDFDTAVLKFTDHTFDELEKVSTQGTAVPRAQKLAIALEERILRETGANLSARLALSLINREQPGFFFASFDGGRRKQFSYVLDHQTRVPSNNFNVNGGEKGLIFKFTWQEHRNEVWMAFYSQEDYQREIVSYSDKNDLIDITHYDLNVDLRKPGKAVRLDAAIRAQPLFPNVLALPFQIGQDLGEFESHRLKKQLRLKQASLGDKLLAFTQEDWESGFTIFLPSAPPQGPIDLEFQLEGDFMLDASREDSHFPRSNGSWFPVHGFRDRATFYLRYIHPKRLKIASVGVRLSEARDNEDEDFVVTKYRMEHPVSAVTFALAHFERHAQDLKWEKGGQNIMLELNSAPGYFRAIKEDFVVAELSNTVRYFTFLFGNYPYPIFSAAVHPYPFGQGFPTLLMLDSTGISRDNKFTYRFLAHETAHQWWGNIVSWRSYRDQWLSEGFAEYSAVLYTGVRAGTEARDDLLALMRRNLKTKPWTETGYGTDRVVDVGPIILGHRLITRKSRNAYRILIYYKGALVLRMLHFLLSDPATGEDKAFFDMMADFVTRYRDSAASTDDFARVAGEHYARSPIGRKYGQKNLDWFFSQWIRTAHMPSYEMRYSFEDDPDGKVLFKGTITQRHVPPNWFMVLPVMFSFKGDRQSRSVVHTYGPTTEFEMKLPTRPTKAELDPHHWVISEETSTKNR